METRIEEMTESLAEIFEEKYVDTCHKIEQIYKEQGGPIKEEIEECVGAVLSKTEMLQQTGEKGEAAYFAIGFLRSSLNTGRLCFCMELLEDILYLDESDTKVYYYPDFLQTCLSADMAYLGKALQKQYIRIKPYEMEGILSFFIDHYTSIILQLLKDVLPGILHEKISQIHTADGLKVVFNDYMQKGIILFEGERGA